MLKKTNSRALNFVNVLLCGQILLAVFYLAYLVLLALPATGVENVEWVRVITVMAMAAAILGIINRPRARFLTPEMTRAEKMFKLVCLGVVDVAACLTVVDLLSLPLGQSELSENSLVKAAGCADASVSARIWTGAKFCLDGDDDWDGVEHGVAVKLSGVRAERGINGCDGGV